MAIGVIGLLAALLLPAVQSARSAAHRLECTDRLRQLGIAFQNYESTYRTYPGDDLNPLRQILPLIDAAAVQTALDEWKTAPYGRLPPLESIAVPMFACPVDPVAVQHQGRHVSYFMNDGSGRQQYGRSGFFQPLEEFVWNGHVLTRGTFSIRPADVTDGLSNTAMLSEQLVGNSDAMTMESLGPQNPGNPRLQAGTSLPYYGSDQLDQFAEECRDRPVWPTDVIFDESCDIVQSSCWPYNHVLTPNQPSCLNGYDVTQEGIEYAARTADSLHVGGVNVTFGDGSVHFVSNSIDLGVWRAVGTRNGGETEGL